MNLFNNIQSKNILVIGDVMLDTYYTGDVKRISPEAPVPVFRKKSERSVLGGAGNVAYNLISAGQNVSMMSIVGKDEAGNKIKELFIEHGINVDLIVSCDRHTTEKTRFLASNNQQVLRLDVEDTDAIDNQFCDKLIAELSNIISKFNLVILSDYLKGFFTYDFTQRIIKIANDNNIPVIVDVKDPNFEKYNNAMLLKPNLKELHDLTGMPVDTDEQIKDASTYLMEKSSVEYILTTCGDRGMMLFGKSFTYSVPAFVQEVFDVTGAGDTTIAYLGTCIANEIDIKESVEVANLAAGIQVSKVGTSPVYWTEIRERALQQSKGSVSKIINEQLIENFRKDHINQKIVFTNGCFDILHIGHIRYLQEASKLGDILIVGINSDGSVKRLKGNDRPINGELDRAEMLSSLEFVDYVAIFEEDTPLNLINNIKPDVLVKGGDYTPENVVGRKEVESRGGKLVLLPYVEGKSTTNIINRIKS